MLALVSTYVAEVMMDFWIQVDHLGAVVAPDMGPSSTAVVVAQAPDQTVPPVCDPSRLARLGRNSISKRRTTYLESRRW